MFLRICYCSAEEAANSAGGVVQLAIRSRHAPDYHIKMDPEYLILSISGRSRILIFEIFYRVGSDVKL